MCNGLRVAIVAVYTPGNRASVFHGTRKHSGETGEGAQLPTVPCGPSYSSLGGHQLQICPSLGIYRPPAPDLPITWDPQPS